MNRYEESLFYYLRNEKLPDIVKYKNLVRFCNVNTVDHLENSYIYYVKNNLKILEDLIIRGADLNHRNRLNDTPILHFAKLNEKEALYYLLQKKVDFNASNNAGENLLFFACNMDQIAIKELVKRGVDVNKRNIEDETPLFYAVSQDNIDAICSLIKYGANIEAKNNFGRTPIFNAVEYDNLLGINLLAKLGADLNVADKSGMTPIDYSRILDRKDCTKLLYRLNIKNKNINKDKDEGRV